TGDVALQDLFGDKNELILIHNMGASCQYCTMWADTLHRSLPYLTSRANVVLVSPDTPDNQAKIAKARNCTSPLDIDSDVAFTKPMGDHQSDGDCAGFRPGTSTSNKPQD